MRIFFDFMCICLTTAEPLDFEHFVLKREHLPRSSFYVNVKLFKLSLRLDNIHNKQEYLVQSLEEADVIFALFAQVCK